MVPDIDPRIQNLRCPFGLHRPAFEKYHVQLGVHEFPREGDPRCTGTDDADIGFDDRTGGLHRKCIGDHIRCIPASVPRERP